MAYVKDDDVYEYDQCEECRLYGDDEYINEDGELVNRCSDCYENPDNYDDGYYIGENNSYVGSRKCKMHMYMRTL